MTPKPGRSELSASWRSKTILIAMFVTVGLICLFAARLGVSLLQQNGGVSPVWPVIGIALTSLLLTLLVLAARWTDHRSVEAAIRHAETKARSLVEHVPAIVYQVQFGSTVTWRYVSQRINSVLGFTPEEWMCDPQLWFKQIHPEDRQEVLQKGMSSSISGRPFLCEYRMFARDGRVVWFRDEGNVVRDREKKSAFVQGVMMDITEKKRAEILQSVLYKLAEQTTSYQTLEQYYQLVHKNVSELMDATNFYIAIFDSVSNEFSFPFSVSERKFSMDPGNAVKALPGYVIANGPLLADSTKINEMSRAGVLQDDGVPFVSWLGVPLKTTEKTLGLISVQSFTEEQKYTYADLTSLSLLAAEVATTLEQKRAEKALHDKSAQLQTINQAMTMFLEKNDWKEASHRLLQSALLETGSEYGFIGAVSNSGSLRVFAHEGVVWHQDVNRDYYENTMQSYEQNGYLEFRNLNNLFGSVITSGRAVVSNDPSNDQRSNHSLPAGHPPLKNFLGVPLYHSSSVIGLIGVANKPGGYSDGDFAKLDFLSQTVVLLYHSYLQAQKQDLLQEELRKSQKMEAIGRLAGGVAHDFNNLLMAITGYCELLLLKLREDPLRTEVKEILKATSQGAALTRQLLAFGRRQVMIPKVIDLNGVLREMEDILTRLLGEDIDLILVCHSQPGVVKADPGQIEQVILNLSLNARDAMPQGGRLLLETFEINVSDAVSTQHFGIPPGSYIVLRVKDTGEGMDEATLNRIFEPFFTTRKTVGGSGLGLATVYGIIKQSNGHVNVQSELGAGTTFEIYLPRVEERSAAVVEVPSVGEVVDRVRTILLVDDNDAVRRATSALLQAHGFGVLEASDGVDAVKVAENHSGAIDLLITDVVMPRMNGASLAQEILQKSPNTKVLFMSGYSEESVLGSNPGATFLQKPFSMGAFFGRIKELLENQSSSN